MSSQAFPLSDFNELEKDVRSITQQTNPQPYMSEQPAKKPVPVKEKWQHFSLICSVDIVEKVKTIAKNEGFSIRDVAEKYLSDGIARYERKYGAIKKQRRNIDDVL